MKRMRRWKLLATTATMAALGLGCTTPQETNPQSVDSSSNALGAFVTAPPDDPDGIAKLRPEVRAMLDSIRRLMREPNLMLNREQTLKLLDTKLKRVRKMVRDDGSVVTEDKFVATSGLFSNPAWDGGFNFRQQSPCTQACKDFQVQVEVFVKEEKDCVHSRTVHAYLHVPLELQPRSGGYAPKEDIHGRGAFFLVTPTKANSPSLEIAFSNGCFSFLSLNHLFHYSEYSDANVLYK